MKTILAILFASELTAAAGQIGVAWDASPVVGVTNYAVFVGTNSLASGNTNWWVFNVGTNRTAQIEVDGGARLYLHARAYWPDGTWATSQNEIQHESRTWPANVRTFSLEATHDLTSTNWQQIGLIRLRLNQ